MERRERVQYNALSVTAFIPQIQFLDSVPDIHMHEHVQEFIDGLFCILGDERKEIRRM